MRRTIATPRTLAGRALLADPTMLTDDGEEAAEEAIDAIEEQAAQQERERIRVRWDTESGDPTKHSAELCHATLNAILAEQS